MDPLCLVMWSMRPDKDRYIKQESFAFDKHENGWKATGGAR
jgi:hypothetical protein